MSFSLAANLAIKKCCYFHEKAVKGRHAAALVIEPWCHMIVLIVCRVFYSV